MAVDDLFLLAGGRITVVNGLPAKKPTNGFRLPPADNEFLIVVHGEQPPLAAESAHFPDVIDINQGISMNTLKRIAGELFVQSA
jgi:hypothetical protein